MILKEWFRAFEIAEALLASLEHWRENERDLENASPGQYVVREWWNRHCMGLSCPLCILSWKLIGSYRDPGRACIGSLCPLKEKIGKTGACCNEWQEARMQIVKLTLKVSHVIAIRERIEKECRKRGLIE